MWGAAVLDLVFPADCPACQRPLGAGRRDPLCGDCWAAIDRIEPPWCRRCGLPLPVPGSAERCGPCAAAPPPLDYARMAARYAGPLREALHAFKFAGRRGLARPLAHLLIECCPEGPEAGLTAVVPVPLAPDRERERGYNQAALLAERVGRTWRVPVRPRWLRRTRATRPQSDLGAAERRANVAGAFSASPRVAGGSVLLVDDIVTTGATVGACAAALRASGARVVGALAVARAV